LLNLIEKTNFCDFLQVEAYDGVFVSDMTTSFQNGLALCAIIHRYRPDLLDFNDLSKKDSFENNQLAFDILEHELGISPAIPAHELADVRRIPDKLTMMSYLSQVYECFRKDIPAVNRMSSVGEDEDDPLDIDYRSTNHRPTGKVSMTKTENNQKNYFAALFRPLQLCQTLVTLEKQTDLRVYW